MTDGFVVYHFCILWIDLQQGYACSLLIWENSKGFSILKERKKGNRFIPFDPNLLLVVYSKEIIKYVEKVLWTKVFITDLSKTEKSSK